MEPTEFTTGALANGEVSKPVPFVVLLGAGRHTFIRILAQFDDTGPLGGTTPTVLITAGIGPEAEVRVDDTDVPIIGSDGQTLVATATGVRTVEDNDTYLVTIEHDKDSGPWSFAIRNEESNTLQFFGFHADDEGATLRPWMQVINDQSIRLGAAGQSTAQVRVRNVGPVALELRGTAGDTFGAPPATIAELPGAPIRPHRVGIVAVTHPPLPEVRFPQSRVFSHTFESNDPNRSHGRVEFTVTPPRRPRFACNAEFDDGTACPCRNFDAFDPPDADTCRTCHHDKGFHGMESRPGPHF